VSRFLLDTHALLWWLMSDPKLSRTARAAIADPANEVLASATSALELATKQRLGKLVAPVRLAAELPNLLRRHRFTPLDVSFRHALEAGDLPGPHRDPWDRLLIAQARVEGLAVVTIDPVFDDYGVPTVW
jgi:PIN domain nuclease of toxin-antitoxin system